MPTFDRRRLAALAHAYPRQYWLMVAGMVISNAGGSLVWPFLLIFASARLELPLAAVGSLITIQSVAGMLASFVAGTLADRLGRKVVMLASLASNGVIYVFLLNATSYLEFVALMALFGVSNPMYQVGADAMLADMIPSEQRTQAYAINRIASNSGFALGPAIGGFLASTSYSLMFYGASIGFLSYAVLVAVRFRETLPSRRAAAPVSEATSSATARPVVAPRRGYGVVANDRRFVAFTLLLSIGLIAPTTLWILLSVYAKANFALPEYLYGWIPTTNALMCVFLQYPVTAVTRRYPPLPVVAAGMGIYAIGAGSVAVMSSFPGFLLSMVILTFGELIVVPVASKFVADLAPPDLRGRYMSVYWLGWAASRGAAPLIGGFVNDQIAPIAIWYVALAIGLASTAGLAVMARASWAATRRMRKPLSAPPPA